MALDEAGPLFLEYGDAKVPFHQTLRTEPWSGRGFIVRDPDGKLIAFAGRQSPISEPLPGSRVLLHANAPPGKTRC